MKQRGKSAPVSHIGTKKAGHGPKPRVLDYSYATPYTCPRASHLTTHTRFSGHLLTHCLSVILLLAGIGLTTNLMASSIPAQAASLNGAQQAMASLTNGETLRLLDGDIAQAMQLQQVLDPSRAPEPRVTAALADMGITTPPAGLRKTAQDLLSAVHELEKMI